MGRILLDKEIVSSGPWRGHYTCDFTDSCQMMTVEGFTVQQMTKLYKDRSLIVCGGLYDKHYKLIEDGKNECEYCEDDTKDIFYGEINGAEVSVFISDSHELELYISENGEEMKKTALMRYCPFCGRRLRQ